MLHYEITGDGSPVVLLHEGIVDSRSWSKVVPLLAPHHTVVTYDQRRQGPARRLGLPRIIDPEEPHLEPTVPLFAEYLRQNHPLASFNDA